MLTHGLEIGPRVESRRWLLAAHNDESATLSAENERTTGAETPNVIGFYSNNASTVLLVVAYCTMYQQRPKNRWGFRFMKAPIRQFLFC